jgi:GntR family transcriptional regulator
MISFILDPKAGVPFYRQIIDQIKFGIATGKLKVGEQLPTVRSLAVDLKVNLNTVAKAYKELEIQNVLETQQGTGTFINTAEINISNSEKKKKFAIYVRNSLP